MSRKAALQLAPGAVSRVIAETCGEDEPPADLDAAILSRDLRAAGTWWRVWSELDDNALWRERYQHAGALAATAGKLLSLLSSESGQWLLRRISGEFPLYEGQENDTAPSIAALQLGIERLRDCSKDEIHRPRPAGADPAPDRRTVPPLQWLIGERLASVYRKHFHGEPSALWPSSANPYARFAAAACREIGAVKTNGRPYALNTVASTFRDHLEGRGARKGKFTRR